MREEGGRGRGRGQRGRERTKGVSDLESHNHHHHDHCHHLSSPRCIIRSHHWPRAIDHPPRPSWHQGCEEVTRWARDAEIVRDLPASQSHKATPQRPRTQRATSRRRRFLLSCANGSASWRGVRTSALKTISGCRWRNACTPLRCAQGHEC